MEIQTAKEEKEEVVVIFKPSAADGFVGDNNIALRTELYSKFPAVGTRRILGTIWKVEVPAGTSTIDVLHLLREEKWSGFIESADISRAENKPSTVLA